MNNLLNVLVKDAPNKVFFSVALGITAGLLYAVMIPMIMMVIGTPMDEAFTDALPTFATITSEAPTSKMAVAFLIVLFATLTTATLSQFFLVQVSLDATAKLRLSFYRKVSRLPIQKLEKIGPSTFMAVITGDVPNIVRGAMAIPGILIDLITIIGVLGFLVYLNIKVFYFIIAALVFGVITYQIPMQLGFRFFQQGRSRLEALHESIRGLIYGAKELKLNHARREQFFAEDLISTEQWLLREDKKGETIHLAADNYGRLIVFFTIGVVIFYLAYFYNIGSEVLTSIVLGLLYLTTPIDGILRKLSSIQRARIALMKFNHIYRHMPSEDMSLEQGDIEPWSHISLKDIRHDYQDGKERSRAFSLGPIDLEIHKGEVLFLVGGNGSGKSTLGKLLSLHYVPNQGELRFGDVVVDDNNRNAYREQVSAIHADFYLFRKLIGIDQQEIERVADQYLRELELQEVVHIDQGSFSTTALSSGQRKRLALVVSFLENRDFYLFDEWAADQDPTFKEIFYNEILPKLRQRNKAIVVISHDDRYFHLADRLVTMEHGRIRDIKKPSQDDAALESEQVLISN